MLAKHWRSGWRITTPSARVVHSAICRRSPTPTAVLPKCNGTGRCAMLRASRPVPLHHRANKAQINLGLRPSLDERRGSGQHLSIYRTFELQWEAREVEPCFSWAVGLDVIRSVATVR